MTTLQASHLGKLKQMPREYGFATQRQMSSGFTANADVRSILLAQIPGAVSVNQAAFENDKQGVDWWVEMNTARHLSVDAKVRKSDWAATHPEADDLALETFSVVERDIPGWTRDTTKKCDYVLWLWCDTGRFCLIPFPMLCSVFTANWRLWREEFPTSQQFTPKGSGGYHSECVFVPRRTLWGQIYQQFGGNLQRSAPTRDVVTW